MLMSRLLGCAPKATGTGATWLRRNTKNTSKLSSRDTSIRPPSLRGSLQTKSPAMAAILISSTPQIHALVARGSVILAEHQAGERDFSQGTPTAVQRVPDILN